MHVLLSILHMPSHMPLIAPLREWLEVERLLGTPEAATLEMGGSALQQRAHMVGELTESMYVMEHTPHVVGLNGCVVYMCICAVGWLAGLSSALGRRGVTSGFTSVGMGVGMSVGMAIGIIIASPAENAHRGTKVDMQGWRHSSRQIGVADQRADERCWGSEPSSPGVHCFHDSHSGLPQ